jgi:hypothetical protein
MAIAFSHLAILSTYTRSLDGVTRMAYGETSLLVPLPEQESFSPLGTIFVASYSYTMSVPCGNGGRQQVSSISANTRSSANGGCNANRSLKSYTAPQFKILTPERAVAELRAKAFPGDTGAQQLLKIATALANKRRE